MSRGQLQALALSLSLPRAATADDPVQSMDPAKADGLAQVLDEPGGDRQVVVSPTTPASRTPSAARACR